MRRLLIVAAAAGVMFGVGAPAAQAMLPGEAASTSVACVWSDQVGYGACIHRLIPDAAPRPPDWR